MTNKEIFDLLINDLENNEFNNIADLFNEDAEVVSSTHGNLKGLKEIKEGLAFKGEKLDYHKIRVFNNVYRSNENKAVTYCYLMVQLGKKINGFMNNFGCGIRVLVEYQNNKISSLRTNMVYEYGNTMLVSGLWHMIDYSKYDGYDTVIIDPIKNNPWTIIKEDKEEKELIDELNECFWHYTFCIDVNNYEELKTFVTDNIALEKLGQKSGSEFCDWMSSRRNKWLEYNGVKIPKEACWNHLGYIKNMEVVSDDYVKADVIRTEPNRIGSKFLTEYNLDAIFYTAYWHVAFKKIEDKWFIDKWGYESISVEDNDQANVRYFK